MSVLVLMLCRLSSFVKLIGSPDDASLGFLSNDHRRYLRQLPQYQKQRFSARFPNTAAAGALDLLERMLVFDPSRRITGIIGRSLMLFFPMISEFLLHREIHLEFVKLRLSGDFK